MGQEMERRWVARGLQLPEQLVATEKKIDQGYMETGSPLSQLRFRTVNEIAGFMTIKEGSGIQRGEEEGEVIKRYRNVDLPAPEVVRAALNVCQYRFPKMRYGFDDELEPWTVDVCGDVLTGIVIVEFEHKDIAVVRAAVPLPWMGDCTEVTDSLSSLHLARLATVLRGTGGDALAALMNRISGSVRTLALVGGPGSGKDGLIRELGPTLPQAHFVPEVATIVMGQVAVTPPMVGDQAFQRTVYSVQNIFEATAMEAALAAGKRLMVCNRGGLDGAAYLPGGAPEFTRVLRTTIQAEYRRYHLVLFVETPSQDIYDACRANNPTRYEEYPQAVATAEHIRELWKGHPNFHTITNDGGWEGKIAQARTVIERFLH